METKEQRQRRMRNANELKANSIKTLALRMNIYTMLPVEICSQLQSINDEDMSDDRNVDDIQRSNQMVENPQAVKGKSGRRSLPKPSKSKSKSLPVSLESSLGSQIDEGAANSSDGDTQDAPPMKLKSRSRKKSTNENEKTVKRLRFDTPDRQQVKAARRLHNTVTLTPGTLTNVATEESFVKLLKKYLEDFDMFDNNCRLACNEKLRKHLKAAMKTTDLSIESMQAQIEMAQLSKNKQKLLEKKNAGEEIDVRLGRAEKNLGNLIGALVKTSANNEIYRGRSQWFSREQLAVQLTANCKTLANTRFLPVLAQHLALEFPKLPQFHEIEVRDDVCLAVGHVLSKWILGRKGKSEQWLGEDDEEDAGDAGDNEVVDGDEDDTSEDDVAVYQHECEIRNHQGLNQEKQPDFECSEISASNSMERTVMQMQSTENGFREHLRRFVAKCDKNSGAKFKNKSAILLKAAEKKFCHDLMEIPLKELRAKLLPAYVTALLPQAGDESGWLSKLSADQYSNIGIFWKLAYDTNCRLEECGRPICQELFPGPNCRARFVDLTTTRLAAVFTDWLKMCGSSDKALKEKLIECGRQLHVDICSGPAPLIDGEAVLTLAGQWIKHPRLLWRFLFPGIHKFVDKCSKSSRSNGPRLMFLNSARVSTDSIQCLFSNLKTRKAKKKGKMEKIKPENFNSKQWQSRCGPNMEPVSIATLAGTRDPEKPGMAGLRGRHNDNFHGRINFDFAVASGHMKTGERELEKLNDTVLIGMDLGVTSEVTMVCARFKYCAASRGFTGEFKRTSRGGAARYLKMGADRHLADKAKLLASALVDIGAYADQHGRTMDADLYSKFAQSFTSAKQKLFAINHSEEAATLASRSRRQKMRYWSHLQNEILALVDSLYTKEELAKGTPSPILVIGDPTFGSCAGHRSAAPAEFIDHMKRSFLVVVVDEYMTSQKCPKCFSPLEKIDEKSIRYWQCTNSRCLSNTPADQQVSTQRFTVNKDVSASMNMINVFWSLLGWKTRPRGMSRPTATIKAGKCVVMNDEI